MKKLEITKLSKRYNVRKLNIDDVETIFHFCKSNTQYYTYCGKEPSIQLIERDLEITPPGIPIEQKYYIGFFKNEKLVAVMDLEDGYPNSDYAYIGFFMMNHELQGKGIGSQIVSESLEYLRGQGFKKCQLGIDKENPQSNHFWRKNGFEVIREVVQEEGTIMVAERLLRTKFKVAFICVHNSCRSQIAEALGKHLASDVFESYSAGTETKPQINQDAVRIMKELYGIDMEETQYSKLISDIPNPDIAISMGCNVGCPFIGRAFDDNWGLEDPTGKRDEEFKVIIAEIERRILHLKQELS